MHLRINHIQIRSIILSTTIPIRWDILMNWTVIWVVWSWFLLLLHWQILWFFIHIHISVILLEIEIWSILLDYIAININVLIWRKFLLLALPYAIICIHYHSINKIWRLDAIHTAILIIRQIISRINHYQLTHVFIFISNLTAIIRMVSIRNPLILVLWLLFLHFKFIKEFLITSIHHLLLRMLYLLTSKIIH